MSYCKSCGAYVPDGETECFACGARIAGEGASRPTERETAEKAAASGATGGAASASADAKYEYRSGSRAASSGARRGADRYYSSERRGPKTGTGPEKYAREYSEDAQENRNLGVLCYLGPLLLIPLLTKPDSSFLRYHCNQGLVLLIFCIICWALKVVPIIGWMICAVGAIIGIMGFLRGLKNVLEGKRSPLPYIGGITILK